MVDCPSGSASRCNPDNNLCSPCMDDMDCAHIENQLVCVSGECVECRSQTEERDCGANSCDSSTNSCTSTARGSINLAEACKSDSECGDALFQETDSVRCVPTDYKGNFFGFRCLRLESTVDGGCTFPFPRTVLAQSASGSTASVYCGVDSMVTTVDAVLFSGLVKSCSEAPFCGITGATCYPTGAICSSLCN